MTPCIQCGMQPQNCKCLNGFQVSSRPPAIHALKTWPEFYAAVVGGRKTFELRKADRDFQEGDILELAEWGPFAREYSGNKIRKIITYVMRGPCFGLAEGWVVLGLATPNE